MNVWFVDGKQAEMAIYEPSVTDEEVKEIKRRVEMEFPEKHAVFFVDCENLPVPTSKTKLGRLRAQAVTEGQIDRLLEELKKNSDNEVLQQVLSDRGEVDRLLSIKTINWDEYKTKPIYYGKRKDRQVTYVLNRCAVVTALKRYRRDTKRSIPRP